MFNNSFTYAQWWRECADRFWAMNDRELLIALADHCYETDRDNLWMISLAHLIDEMKNRGWDISPLWIEHNHEIRPCMLKNNTLMPLTIDSSSSLEQLKQQILTEYEREKNLTPPQKKWVIHWLQKHLWRKEVKKIHDTLPHCLSSFSLVCTRHGKMGRYDKIREYDIYFVNHSDATYQHVWLSTSFPYGEEDSEIWPITGHSIHHLCTATKKQINSPYIFDFYEHLGMKPTRFIAEIPETALHSRDRKYIKSLNQEWWEIEIKRMEEDS